MMVYMSYETWLYTDDGSDLVTIDFGDVIVYKYLHKKSMPGYEIRNKLEPCFVRLIETQDLR